MLQVLQEILLNPEDHTKVTLLFANQTQNDIMLKDELDELAKEHENFKVLYVVSINYYIGFYTEKSTNEPSDTTSSPYRKKYKRAVGHNFIADSSTHRIPTRSQARSTLRARTHTHPSVAFDQRFS